MSQFDTRFTKQTPIDSPDDSTLSESANMVFQVMHKQLKLTNLIIFEIFFSFRVLHMSRHQSSKRCIGLKL